MTNVPLVDLKAQLETIRAEIDEAISTCLAKTSFVGGAALSRFEDEFAAFCGTGFAVGASSGTTALHLALAAAGVGAGDEVIVPSHTFMATVESILHCGARPVFVDIEEESYTIDSTLIEERITDRTRAIVPVHIYGRLADMKTISEIAEAKGLLVVEDAAQAHGAQGEDGKKAGSLGISAAFSFFPGKNLGAYGDGGMLTTDDVELARKAKKLANHGRSGKYEHEIIGFNYRLDAMQAAVLTVKLKYLELWNNRRNSLAFRYNELLKEAPGIVLPEVSAGHVFHLYVIRVSNREHFMSVLNSRGISAGIHYPIPCHQQPCLNTGDSLPVTERIAQEIVSLPIYPELSEEQQLRVVDAVFEASELETKFFAKGLGN